MWRTKGYKTGSPTGPYYQNEPAPLVPYKDHGRMFYLDTAGGRDGDFQPGLRWEWADKVDGVGRAIGHTGWWTEDEGGDKLRGMVFRLPRQRGFLAGYSMGEGMIGEVEYTIYDDELTAAFAADKLAEHAAERSREEWEREQENNDDD